MITFSDFTKTRPCYFHAEMNCDHGRMCNACEHQPADEDKPNGKNPPMVCKSVLECPACGEATYATSERMVCAFCGQRLIIGGEQGENA